MVRPRSATLNAPRSRRELAQIRLTEGAITKLEAEADRRGTTRISIANEIIGQLADELAGKPSPVHLVKVRCSVTV